MILDIDYDREWDFPSEHQDSIKQYKNICLELSNSEEFYNFKQNSYYRKMLEGGPKFTGDYFLDLIKNHELYTFFIDNLEVFFINDLIGNPDIYDFGDGIKGSITSIKYAYNILNILQFIQKNKINHLVEVGPGYGGLSIVLDKLINLKKITFIDLEESNAFNKRYIREFPEFEKKCSFISSEKYKEVKIDNIDLFIGINSFTEDKVEVQKNYYEYIISKSKFSYIVRSIATTYKIKTHKECISLLGDEFLVDDSEIIEKDKDNMVVFIKREN
jgi:putative sugar O-methyltransferase